MEEKEKVCSENLEQEENVSAEEAGSLTEEELEDAAGGNYTSTTYGKRGSGFKKYA